MKKIIAALAAFTMCAAVFTACGNDSSSSENESSSSASEKKDGETVTAAVIYNGISIEINGDPSVLPKTDDRISAPACTGGGEQVTYNYEKGDIQVGSIEKNDKGESYITFVGVYSDKFETADGVKIGMKLDDVKKIYGEPSEVSSDGKTSRWVTADGKGSVSLYGSDEVERIEMALVKR